MNGPADVVFIVLAPSADKGVDQVEVDVASISTRIHFPLVPLADLGGLDNTKTQSCRTSRFRRQKVETLNCSKDVFAIGYAIGLKNQNQKEAIQDRCLHMQSHLCSVSILYPYSVIGEVQRVKCVIIIIITSLSHSRTLSAHRIPGRPFAFVAGRRLDSLPSGR